MSKTVLHDGDEGVSLIVRDAKKKKPKKPVRIEVDSRSPVHVVYGGANLFRSGTPRKLGEIALKALDNYAPNFVEFANVLSLTETDALSKNRKQIERQFANDPERLKQTSYPAWLAASVYESTRRKLQTEPVEDFRIDFEDGYGFRPDAEEDADAERTASELAAAFRDGSITPFSGFRVKAYGDETRKRAKRTLQIFLSSFLKASNGRLPDNFVVTLPKVTDKKEVADLCRDIKKIEKKAHLAAGSIKIEVMIEHPLAIIDRKGNFALQGIVDKADGRCVAAHFGAYDYTASLGIAASHQDIAHPACDFARQMMLVGLGPLGVRLSDSVTTRMPVAVHKAAKLTVNQSEENRREVAEGLRTHFANVRRSMANGFYQSWDLHPNQLIARYAAVYSFFLETFDAQAARLRSFIDRAAQATLTGHAFDDAATAMGIVKFFRQGLDCGALNENDIKNATGLSAADFKITSFNKIAEGRQIR